MEKPGYKTTEFWISLCTLVVGILALFGLVPVGEQGELSDAIVKIIGGVAIIASTVFYIISRWIAKTLK